jgi:hypothetical protein
MATTTQAKPLNKRETSNLIGSDKLREHPYIGRTATASDRSSAL